MAAVSSRIGRACVAAMVAWFASSARGQSASRPDAAGTLRTKLGLGTAEVARVERGELVTRRVAGIGGEEVAFVAAVRVKGTAAAVASRVYTEDLPAESPAVRQRGGFSRRPLSDDLQSFELPSADADALRDCVVGACVLKLPVETITALRALDWAAPDIATRASSVMRGWLLAYARGYISRGNDSLVVYSDGRSPRALHEGFHELLGASPLWADDAPEFHHYLDVYPRRPLGGVRDTLAWYVDEFGLRPLTTVVHTALYMPNASAGGERSIGALIARKQIFASHYFRARLSMLAFVDAVPASPGGEAVTYVVWLERALFDTKLGRFVRGRVEGRLEEDLRSRLTAVRRALDRDGTDRGRSSAARW